MESDDELAATKAAQRRHIQALQFTRDDNGLDSSMEMRDDSLMEGSRTSLLENSVNEDALLHHSSRLSQNRFRNAASQLLDEDYLEHGHNSRSIKGLWRNPLDECNHGTHVDIGRISEGDIDDEFDDEYKTNEENRSHGVMRQISNGLATRKEVVRCIFGFDDDEVEEDENYVEDLEQSSRSQTSAKSYSRGIPAGKGPRSELAYTDSTPLRGSNSSGHVAMQPGAISFQGRQGRVQRKGVLTLLEENRTIPDRVSSIVEEEEEEKEDEASVQSAVVITDTTVHDNKRCLGSCRRNRKVFNTSVVLLFLGAAGIMMAVIFSLRAPSSSDPKSAIASIDGNNSSSYQIVEQLIAHCDGGGVTDPFPLPSDLFLRVRDIQKLLLDSNFTNCSAQHMAILHLATTVPLLEDINPEQYAVLVFYYSTTSYENNEITIEESDHCQWTGIVCSGDESNRIAELVWEAKSLEGTIPSELFLLTHLRVLGLSYNRLGSTIPTEVRELTSLSTLILTANVLTGSLPTQLGDVASLEVLMLGNNELSGSIITELGFLTNLFILELDRNSFQSATIPEEVWSLTRLARLHLGEMSIDGTIPTEIGQLTELEFLGLWRNNLEASVPSEIGKLTKLTSLYLDLNRLSGFLPSEIGRLTKLSALALSANTFSGVIPSEFTALSNLEKLDVSGNLGLSGDLDELCDVITPTKETEFRADGTNSHKEPCGVNWGVRCKCCTT